MLTICILFYSTTDQPIECLTLKESSVLDALGQDYPAGEQWTLNSLVTGFPEERLSYCGIWSSKIFPGILDHRNSWFNVENCTIVHAPTETCDISAEHRETNENPQEQLPILLNAIPDMGEWQGWEKKWPQPVVRWLSVISITFTTNTGNGWLYHQLFPQLWQNQAPILCLIQKKHLQRRWSSVYAKYYPPNSSPG